MARNCSRISGTAGTMLIDESTFPTSFNLNQQLLNEMMSRSFGAHVVGTLGKPITKSFKLGCGGADQVCLTVTLHEELCHHFTESSAAWFPQLWCVWQPAESNMSKCLGLRSLA